MLVIVFLLLCAEEIRGAFNGSGQVCEGCVSGMQEGLGEPAGMGDALLAQWYNDTLAQWLLATAAMEAVASTPLSYRVIATSMHVVIFCLGVTGNVMLIIVVHKSKFLRSPTYRYL
ncbi:thyrotropin-releasing hormone receptor-like, partial [Paramacrobiotus metropolitanus]|uniref:thyrotropin-releasing hormone receptor-like n=1 Tax=Paramacrobiotus metropolitanus TaxID=2943436 RepID=UPI0024460C67